MFYVYILASRKHGTLYIGVTRDLAGRIHLHRTGTGSEFVSKYGVFRLVWAQPFETAADAITHEKRLKRWRRAWKVQLIETDNPEWRDLYANLTEPEHPAGEGVTGEVSVSAAPHPTK